MIRWPYLTTAERGLLLVFGIAVFLVVVLILSMVLNR